MLLLIFASLLFYGAAWSLQATQACLSESQGRCQPHPTLAEVRERAAQWKQMTIELLMEFPAVFLVRGFLKLAELYEIRRLAHTSDMKQRSGKLGYTNSPQSFRLAPVLDERMAILTGLSKESVEEGYFHFYSPGSEPLSVHQDNNFVTKDSDSHRIASFVIFIDGEGEGVVGGHTVFPLLNFSSGSMTKQVKISKLAEWDATLNAGNIKTAPGRHCMESKVYAHDALCKSLLKFAQKACNKQSSHHRVAPLAGDAILFYHLGNESKLTNLAVHGSCPVKSGMKISLAKFLLQPKQLEVWKANKSQSGVFKRFSRQPQAVTAKKWTDL